MNDVQTVEHSLCSGTEDFKGSTTFPKKVPYEISESSLTTEF
jgi:hypothetical protein